MDSSVLDNELSIHHIPGANFSEVGVKGYCSFVSLLPYVCPNNLFVLPVAHLLLYGVIRDINRYIFTKPRTTHKYALTASQRKTVWARRKGFHSVSDFPNSYKNVLKELNSWKLKAWIDWCDVHVRTVMRDIEIGGDPVFTELYHKVHRAALYFCKNSVGHYTRDPCA